jgi:hypothetical protein
MNDVKRIYLSWQDVDKMITGMLSRLQPFNFDMVIAITRGGIVPAAIIAERLAIQQVLVASVAFYEDEEHDLDWPVFMQFPDDSLLRGQHALIVDDIWDRGKQIMSVTERVKYAGGRSHSVVLHYKPHRSQFPDKAPDLYGAQTEDWIIYPWDAERGKFGVKN